MFRSKPQHFHIFLKSFHCLAGDLILCMILVSPSMLVQCWQLVGKSVPLQAALYFKIYKSTKHFQGLTTEKKKHTDNQMTFVYSFSISVQIQRQCWVIVIDLEIYFRICNITHNKKKIPNFITWFPGDLVRALESTFAFCLYSDRKCIQAHKTHSNIDEFHGIR